MKVFSVGTLAFFATSVASRSFSESPIFPVVLNGEEVEVIRRVTRGGGVRYWTGSEVYIPSAMNNYLVLPSAMNKVLSSASPAQIRQGLTEERFLKKDMLGPVAVMINLAMTRKIFSWPRPNRWKVFSKALLNIGRKMSQNGSDLGEQQTRLLEYHCDHDDHRSSKAYDTVRKKYKEAIEAIERKKPIFEAGNPSFFASRKYYTSLEKRKKKALKDLGEGSDNQRERENVLESLDKTPWTWEDAVKLGTLQVKCGMLWLLRRNYEVDEEITRLPEDLKDLLKAKIGLPSDLFSKLKLKGWKLTYTDKKNTLDDVLKAVVHDVMTQVSGE